MKQIDVNKVPLQTDIKRSFIEFRNLPLINRDSVLLTSFTIMNLEGGTFQMVPRWLSGVKSKMDVKLKEKVFETNNHQ